MTANGSLLFIYGINPTSFDKTATAVFVIEIWQITGILQIKCYYDYHV